MWQDIAAHWLAERWLAPPPSGRLLRAALIVLMILLVAALVYVTGGITFVYSHTIYIPILLAARLFGVPGGLLAGVLGGLVLGPYMPLNTATGEMQDAANWIYRLVMLSLVGSFVGLLFAVLRAQIHRIRAAAYVDRETGLANQTALNEILDEICVGHAADAPVLLAAFRLNNFQDIVGTLGHPVGAPLVNAIAARLLDLAGAQARVFRIATDQLALLVPGAGGPDDSTAWQGALADPFDIDGLPIHVDASAGVAVFPDHETASGSALLRKAVAAMHRGSGTGAPLQVYDSAHDDGSRDNLLLLGELRAAIETGQLELHFQPKLHLASGKISGVEALIRWRHPERGLVPPGLFIPSAERTALIHPLTRWVIRAAARQLQSWRDEGLHTRIAVNLSARNFVDPGLLPTVAHCLDGAQLRSGDLEFEITESAVLDDHGRCISTLARLRDLGCGVAIDDFGTGQSSMAYLKHLPATVLKIDQAFIGPLLTEAADARITEASIRLAHGLGLQVVAEGVEDAATLARLADWHCDYAQGYHIARPMPAGDLVAWLQDHELV